MQSVYKVGKFAGLEISFEMSAVIGSVAIWIVFTILTMLIPGKSLLMSLVIGLILTVAHWVAVLLHLIGHAIASQSTGYPMNGIQAWIVLGRTLYPADEPELAASIHRRRALGGPIFSFVVSIVVGIILLAVWTQVRATISWILLLFFLENFVVFALGSFLPLGFTDGSTLLSLRGK